MYSSTSDVYSDPATPFGFASTNPNEATWSERNHTSTGGSANHSLNNPRDDNNNYSHENNNSNYNDAWTSHERTHITSSSSTCGQDGYDDRDLPNVPASSYGDNAFGSGGGGSSGGGGGEGGHVCHKCGFDATRRVSQTASNPNRAFIKCNDPQCNGFAWEDEVDAGGGGDMGGGGGAWNGGGGGGGGGSYENYDFTCDGGGGSEIGGFGLP